MNARRFLWMVLPLFVLLGAVYARVIPVGEAPDEPAHLAYIDHIVGEGSLPPIGLERGPYAYESFQPPLDYLVSALLLRGLHGGPAAYPFAASANPGFDRRPGSRAFLDRPGAESAARVVRRLRQARLFWGALTVFFVFEVARILAAPGREWAVSAAIPFCLAPQLIFNTAVVNNDTAVTALSSATIYGLCRLVSRREDGVFWSVMTGAAAGLALWSKLSGLFLALPLGFAAVVLWRQGRRKTATGLVLAFAVLAAGWLALSLARSGPMIGVGPGSDPAPGWGQLIAEPAWPARVWASFWANFGWMNLLLPKPVYLFFLPPTLFALWGGIVTVRDARRSLAGAAPERVALLAAISNLGFLAAYLAGVLWQPQGRHLFPSIAAFAGLAVKGLGDLGARLRIPPSLSRAIPVFLFLASAAIAAFGAWWMARTY
ncbi:MAG TPA: glycosyltransferase family 39 protein [Thermoanaerobaculia bacterium]|nr:glycosyltransferase family 39 protein [Thermoanaerobaculia bacterium]